MRTVLTRSLAAFSDRKEAPDPGFAALVPGFAAGKPGFAARQRQIASNRRRRISRNGLRSLGRRLRISFRGRTVRLPGRPSPAMQRRHSARREHRRPTLDRLCLDIIDNGAKLKLKENDYTEISRCPGRSPLVVGFPGSAWKRIGCNLLRLSDLQIRELRRGRRDVLGGRAWGERRRYGLYRDERRSMAQRTFVLSAGWRLL